METPDTAPPSTSPGGDGAAEGGRPVPLGEALSRLTAQPTSEPPPSPAPAPYSPWSSPSRPASPPRDWFAPQQPGDRAYGRAPYPPRSPHGRAAYPPQPAQPQPAQPQPAQPQPAPPPPTQPHYDPPRFDPSQAGEQRYGEPQYGQPSIYRPGSYRPQPVEYRSPAGYPYPNPPGQPGEWPGAYPAPYPPQIVGGRRAPRRRTVPLLVIAIVIALAATVTVVVLHPGRHVTATGGIGTSSSDSPTVPPKNPRSIGSVLAAQTSALLAGDRTRFLATVDPSAPAAVASYKRLYANLRALHVAVWTQSAAGEDTTITGTARYDIQVSYCFVVKTCRDVSAVLHVTAAVRGGHALIESYRAPASDERLDEPIPWETTTLSAVTGPRVVVAASSAESSRLNQALPIAERAAAAADKYAKWGKPPIYVVYLAGSSDARTWFGGGLAHSTGESIGLSATDIEVMVVLPAAAETRFAGPGALSTVIQHEMGHVATLYGDTQASGHDSFIEGIAEYVAYNGHPNWATYRLENTREYLQTGKWSGQCYMTKEITSSDVLTGSAAYGIGYLTIKYLVSTYGLTKALNFWAGVEREKLTVDEASRKYLGSGWVTVNASCARYVRATV